MRFLRRSGLSPYLQRALLLDTEAATTGTLVF